MDNERWEQLKENIKKKFNVTYEQTEDLMMDTGEGEVKQGTQDILEVETPVGKIRLVREEKPKVLDKKMIFSHRQGQSAQTEYTFSDTEKTHKLRIYKWSPKEEDWMELDEASLSGLM